MTKDDRPNPGQDQESREGQRDPPALDAVRAAACEFLDRTFVSLHEQHVLPRPRFAPWIRMARDYYGDMVRGSAAFEAALKDAWPERFTYRPANPTPEFASFYERALLEDAVHAATSAEEAYDATGPAVSQAIERLVGRLVTPPAIAVALVIADLKTRDGTPLDVAGVHLESTPNGSERLLEREIPGSGYMLDREDAVSLGGYGTAVAITHQGGGPRFEEARGRGRDRLQRLVSTIRLATGSTVRPMAEVAGEAGTSQVFGPYVTPLRHGRLLWVHRTAVIGSEDVHWLEELTRIVAQAESSPLPSTMIALGYLGRVMNEPGRSLADLAVDSATGLEAALSGQRADGEIGLRLRGRAAALLSTASDPPATIYNDVRVLYNLRSAFVHGSSMSPEDVWKLLGKTSIAQSTKWRGEQHELVLDRWCDLLRRSILVRLALAAPPDPVWPLAGKDVDVDAVMVQPSETQRWRTKIADYWASIGLPTATEPPGPLEGLLSRNAEEVDISAATPQV